MDRQMTDGYRIHDDAGQAWVEVPRDQIEQLGIGGVLSARSRRSPDGSMVYIHEHEDFQRFVTALGVAPEALALDEDVVMRSPVGGYPAYEAEAGRGNP